MKSKTKTYKLNHFLFALLVFAAMFMSTVGCNYRVAKPKFNVGDSVEIDVNGLTTTGMVLKIEYGIDNINPNEICYEIDCNLLDGEYHSNNIQWFSSKHIVKRCRKIEEMSKNTTVINEPASNILLLARLVFEKKTKQEIKKTPTQPCTLPLEIEWHLSPRMPISRIEQEKYLPQNVRCVRPEWKSSGRVTLCGSINDALKYTLEKKNYDGTWYPFSFDSGRWLIIPYGNFFGPESYAHVSIIYICSPQMHLASGNYRIKAFFKFSSERDGSKYDFDVSQDFYFQISETQEAERDNILAWLLFHQKITQKKLLLQNEKEVLFEYLHNVGEKFHIGVDYEIDGLLSSIYIAESMDELAYLRYVEHLKHVPDLVSMEWKLQQLKKLALKLNKNNPELEIIKFRKQNALPVPNEYQRSVIMKQGEK